MGSEDAAGFRQHGRQTAGMSRGGPVPIMTAGVAALILHAPSAASLHVVFQSEVIRLHWTAFDCPAFHPLLTTKPKPFTFALAKVSRPNLTAYRSCFGSLEKDPLHSPTSRPEPGDIENQAVRHDGCIPVDCYLRPKSPTPAV